MSVCVWGTVYMRLTLHLKYCFCKYTLTFLRFKRCIEFICKYISKIFLAHVAHCLSEAAALQCPYWLCKCLSMKLNGSSFPGLFCSIASHPLSRFSFVLFFFVYLLLAYYTPFCSVSDEKLRAVQRSASLKFWVTWKYSWSLCKTDLVKTFSAFLYVD